MGKRWYRWNWTANYNVVSYLVERDKKSLLPWHYRFYPFDENKAIIVSWREKDGETVKKTK